MSPILENLVDRLARTLAGERPPPDADGAWRFVLADDMRLAVRSAPDGRSSIVWAEASAATVDASAAAREARAALFLRLRLARLRRNPAMALAMDDDGVCVLHQKISLDSEHDWLDAVSALLNEAEAIRKLAASETGAAEPKARPQSMFSLDAWRTRP